MSKAIELEDSEVAVELVQFAYFKKVRTALQLHNSGQTKDFCSNMLVFFTSLCRFWRK